MKKVSTKTKNKKEAQKFLFGFEKTTQEQNKSKFFTLTSLRDFVLDYIKCNMTKSTHQLYNRAFREFINIVGNKIAFEVTPEDIEFFKKTRLFSVSPVTLNIEIRNLKASYNLARKFKHSTHNPFVDIKQIKEVQKEKMTFTENEILLLIDTIDIPLLKDFVQIGLYTGMRLAEILNLQWKDIFLGEKIIKVLNKENHRTKTTRIRSIPISEKLYPILLEMKNQTIGDYTEEKYLFQSYTKRPFDKSFITTKFKYFVMKAELPSYLHFHNLRHTFITQLLRKGVSIYKVKVLAGHSTIKTTEGYAHLIVEDLRDAVNVL
ncbi:MAG: tyrosine-type recombinase/integrase [Ignavibacteria bacterium]